MSRVCLNNGLLAHERVFGVPREVEHQVERGLVEPLEVVREKNPVGSSRKDFKHTHKNTA